MNRTSLYCGRVVDLGLERAVRPDGRSFELEVVRHPGGAGVVALDETGRVCLIRQYRHAAGGWLWEVPAGKLDPGEDPLATAQRELAEEAGLEAARWRSLGRMLSTPGFCDEVIHLYLATGLTAIPTRHQEDELIEVHWRPFDEVHRAALAGELEDAKTVVALCRAFAAMEARS